MSMGFQNLIGKRQTIEKQEFHSFQVTFSVLSQMGQSD